MSADNTIVILKTSDKFKIMKPGCYKNLFGERVTAYRVAHVQAVENYDSYKISEPHVVGAWMVDGFKRSQVFYDEDEAMDFAMRLEDEIGYVEYGIKMLDATEYNFPYC